MLHFAIVPRTEIDTGQIALFWRDESGQLQCYAWVGQHAEACPEYYRTRTRPVAAAAALPLFEHWAALPGGDGCKFTLRQRLAHVR